MSQILKLSAADGQLLNLTSLQNLDSVYYTLYIVLKTNLDI